MSSEVYFINFRASFKENLFKKLDKLLDAAKISDIVKKRNLVAVKLHFGETGNNAFIRPIFFREIVRKIKAVGGAPFLTDANTLYAGTRGDAVHHTITAIQNGFAYSVVAAPIIIADGLMGRSQTGVRIDHKHVQTAYIGSEIVNADVLISVAHFKGHEFSGFGGSIKNVGMGCASRAGKLVQHSGLSPKVKLKKCIGCGDCIDHCSQAAIILAEKKAVIDPSTCIGCGECILICPQNAIQVQHGKSLPEFMEKMVEYTSGVLKNKQGKALFLNFINNVSPACDCWPASDTPIVRDIGILASTDPVAIDQAAADLVNQEPALAESCLKTGRGAGDDKFKALYPKVEWEHQLAYAEKLGLGKRVYNLVQI